MAHQCKLMFKPLSRSNAQPMITTSLTLAFCVLFCALDSTVRVAVFGDYPTIVYWLFTFTNTITNITVKLSEVCGVATRDMTQRHTWSFCSLSDRQKIVVGSAPLHGSSEISTMIPFSEQDRVRSLSAKPCWNVEPEEVTGNTRQSTAGGEETHYQHQRERAWAS